VKNVIAHVEDKCTQMANGSGGWNNMLQMSAGQMFECSLIVHFYDSNGAEYRIYMGPNWEPETTYTKVTCNFGCERQFGMRRLVYRSYCGERGDWSSRLFQQAQHS
jgi:hypothetical protein